MCPLSSFLCFFSKALDMLRSEIEKSKGLKVTAVRPLVLAAEENLHNMVVDLDRVVTKVSSISFLLGFMFRLTLPACLQWFP